MRSAEDQSHPPVKSPLSPDGDAEFEREIPSDMIIRQYHDYGVDVRRFFDGFSTLSIYRCTKTGYRFYYPFSLVGDDLFYDQLQQVSETYYYPFREEFDIAIRQLQPGDQVLEVGAGDGTFLEKLTYLEISGTGLELSSLAFNKCVSKGLNVHRVPLAEFSRENPERFDAVVMFQVLEHIPDVSQFLSHALDCLRPGGKLIIAVPDNSPYYQNFRLRLTLNLPPHHMGLWNAESLSSIQNIFNVKLSSIEYDHDYAPLIKYAYFMGDLFVSRFSGLYRNSLLRRGLSFLLLPFTFPSVVMKNIRSELRPHSVVATFQKL